MDTTVLNENKYVALTQIEKDNQLLEASRLGKTEEVKMLLKAGADINARDAKYYRKRTPLIKATVNAQIEVMNVLIENKAKLELKDKEGCTALIWSARGDHFKTELFKILVQAGADIHTKTNENETTLMWGARAGLLDIVDSLIEKGASTTEVNTNNETALGIVLSIKRDLLKLALEAEEVQLEGYNQILDSLLSVTSHEQLKKEMKPVLSDVIDACYKNFKQAVIDHRKGVFNLFGPLALDKNEKNYFFMLIPDVIALIVTKYLELENKREIKKAPSWHKHHAKLEGEAISRAVNEIRFMPLYSKQIENKQKRNCKIAEINNNDENNLILPEKTKPGCFL